MAFTSTSLKNICGDISPNLISDITIGKCSALMIGAAPQRALKGVKGKRLTYLNNSYAKPPKGKPVQLKLPLKIAGMANDGHPRRRYPDRCKANQERKSCVFPPSARNFAQVDTLS